MKKRKKEKQILPTTSDKFVISIIIITVLLLGGVVFLAGKMTSSVQIEPESEAKAKVAKNYHDWGEINMNDGKVEKDFTIENEGSKPLKLFNVKTSCMCTTAQLRFGNEISPIFGMHSKSNYVLQIPPGKIGILHVVFDPAYHGPSGVGSITRQVNVSTNDSENSELTFVLTALVNR